MTFHSILFERNEDDPDPETVEEPVFFRDLNLDQVVEAITASKQEYSLKPFFYLPLGDVEAVQFRHEIMQDLKKPALFQHIQSFANAMQEMRRHLKQVEDLYYVLQKHSWFLDAVAIYCQAVAELATAMSRTALASRGFVAFRSYLADTIAGEPFTTLVAETEALKDDLDGIEYNMRIYGNSVRVLRYEDETDYSVEVEATFKKFKQGDVKDHRQEFGSQVNMNHVEAQIVAYVAQLFPNIFRRLGAFRAQHAGYLDATIARFDREVQFYVAYLQHMAMMRRAGLHFCYPQVSRDEKDIANEDGFDLALANKLLQERLPIVCNDFELQDPERIIVVSGPNQGGKTTFARLFGQLHYLASLGLPVPGREARLYLFDNIFTHFEREEDISDLRGKLQDDLIRIHEILERATSDSVIIINEIFTSTTSQDATFLSKEIMNRIIEMDALCVCVTFIDELASLSEKTVSMVSTVVPEDPAVRTFKIVRMPADGLAYAISIAEKHRLTYEQIKDRING